MKDNLFIKKVPLYYDTDDSQLIVGDSFKVLTRMKPESVDMIFADPPYFLKKRWDYLQWRKDGFSK